MSNEDDYYNMSTDKLYELLDQKQEERMKLFQRRDGAKLLFSQTRQRMDSKEWDQLNRNIYRLGQEVKLLWKEVHSRQDREEPNYDTEEEHDPTDSGRSKWISV